MHYPVCRICSSLVQDQLGHLKYHMNEGGFYSIDWESCPFCGDDRDKRGPSGWLFLCGHDFDDLVDRYFKEKQAHLLRGKK